MSKNPTQLFLPAAKSGWECWNLVPSGDAILIESLPNLSDVSKSNKIYIGIPAKDVTTLPLKILSNDESLFPGAVQIANEGIVPFAEDLDAIQGNAYLGNGSEKDGSLVTALSLRHENWDKYPNLISAVFEPSASFYSVDLIADVVSCWQEHECWVMAFYKKSSLFHIEILYDLLDDVRTCVFLAKSQLAAKGIPFDPQTILFWDYDPDPDMRSKLRNTVTGTSEEGRFEEIRFAEKPFPSLPRASSRLLPASIQTLRTEKNKRKQRSWFILGVFFIAIICHGTPYQERSASAPKDCEYRTGNRKILTSVGTQSSASAEVGRTLISDYAELATGAISINHLTPPAESGNSIRRSRYF